jgi:non-heme chloroperoxidase
MKQILWILLLGAPLIMQISCTRNKPAQKKDDSANATQFVVVDKEVKLEVVDWGGAGKELVMLAGLGGDAHVFDEFAPKLVAAGNHVYGITRRIFGNSNVPPSWYLADRLGDDVLAVIDALHLDRPVLVGHSYGGLELSSVGSRYPEKISGLIYLDAAYRYAFYDCVNGDIYLDSQELLSRVERLYSGKEQMDFDQSLREMESLQAFLPMFEKSLQYQIKVSKGMRDKLRSVKKASPDLQMAIAGWKKFTAINVPILAIYAIPNPENAPYPNEAETLASDFETCMPSARVVRLQNADHFVYHSNEADVLREIKDFLSHLPQKH